MRGSKGAPAGSGANASAAGEETIETAADKAKKTGSKKSIILILAGLVVTGALAGWDWIRRLPKD